MKTSSSVCQSPQRPHVAILGAGPAGLGAAWQLRRSHKASVTILESRDVVGGNAGGFEIDGVQVDYGSHRLHPSCAPLILADLKRVMGDDLLDRPRHGRIRLRGRWIHFPLKPADLALRLPWSFGAGVLKDAVLKPFRRPLATLEESFASVLKNGLGETICRDFYFPYAVKMWGRSPDQLSATQARRRVSAGSLGKMLRKVLAVVPGMRAPGAGRFFYPRGGFGQISRVIADEAVRLGADLRFSARVARITLGKPHVVEFECGGSVAQLHADHVWSTIPVALLPKMIVPDAPQEVVDAASRTRSRAMILIYVVIAADQFSPYDAHYFPEAHIPLTRLSEPKNYSARSEPAGRTVLCGELPCDTTEPVWSASDESLGQLVCDSLAACGIPINAPMIRVVTRRLPHAYPIYPAGYESDFDRLDEWVSRLDDVLSFGRQGLFAHDNTHHALAMAYAAVDCLTPEGRFDRSQWRAYREEFARHVVED